MSDRVLIIDDEKSIVDSLVDALSVHGITARGETNPELAIESFKANPTDVVVVDYSFPGKMNGVYIIEKLQKFRPYTQFFLISGWINQDLDEETLSQELQNLLLAKRYFQKPVDSDMLLSAIQDALKSVEEVSDDWQSIAAHYIQNSNVTHDQIRAINEKIKSHLISAIDEGKNEDIKGKA